MVGINEWDNNFLTFKILLCSIRVKIKKKKIVAN